ncbi:MAG: Hypothetical protein AJITA_00376 [Acetilactobacillus jinshanensis]
MGKKRVYTLARELHMSSKQLITKANHKGNHIKNHMVTLDPKQETKVRKAVKPTRNVKPSNNHKSNHHQSNHHNNNHRVNNHKKVVII